MMNKIKQGDKGKTIKGSGYILCQLSTIRKLHLLFNYSHKPWLCSFLYMVTKYITATCIEITFLLSINTIKADW